MGLLSRISSLQNNSDPIVRKKKSLIEVFFSDAKKLCTGFEYSEQLFKLLCRDLYIEKGALLIPDSEGSRFLPVSFLNIDMTTTRHLRIERTILETQFNHYNEIISDSDNRIKLFKQYFSIREFSALNSLMLVPFYIKGTLSAFLFIINPKKEIVEIAGEISLKSEKLIYKLLNSRKPFSTISMPVRNDLDTSPVIILQDFIDNNIAEYITILIITMNIKHLKNSLIKLLPNADSFEISNNIPSSINRLISNSGKIIRLHPDQYLMFYKIKTGTTPDLVLHQINTSITSFFNLSVSLPEIEVDIKTYQASGNNSASTILEGIV